MKVKVSGKVSDLFTARLSNGLEYNGYVPDVLGIGEGDYIQFELDLETGQIVNFKPPEAWQISEVFNDGGEDDEGW